MLFRCTSVASGNTFEIKKLIVDGLTDRGEMAKEITIEDDGLLIYQLECYGADHLTKSFKVNNVEIEPISTYTNNNWLNNLYYKAVVKNDIVKINNTLTRFDYGNVVASIYLIVNKKGITRYSASNKLITNNVNLKQPTIITNSIIFNDGDSKTYTATEDSFIVVMSSGRHRNTLGAHAKINNMDLERIYYTETASDKVSYLFFTPIAKDETIEMTFSISNNRGNANCFVIAKM